VGRPNAYLSAEFVSWRGGAEDEREPTKKGKKSEEREKKDSKPKPSWKRSKRRMQISGGGNDSGVLRGNVRKKGINKEKRIALYVTTRRRKRCALLGGGGFGIIQRNGGQNQKKGGRGRENRARGRKGEGVTSSEMVCQSRAELKIHRRKGKSKHSHATEGETKRAAIAGRKIKVIDQMASGFLKRRCKSCNVVPGWGRMY